MGGPFRFSLRTCDGDSRSILNRSFESVRSRFSSIFVIKMIFSYYFSSFFTLNSGATLTVTGNVAASSQYSITDSKFTVGGTFTSNANGNVDSFGGSQVQLANVSVNANSNAFNFAFTAVADSSSSLEIGTAGGAAVGSITIDNGMTV